MTIMVTLPSINTKLELVNDRLWQVFSDGNWDPSLLSFERIQGSLYIDGPHGWKFTLQLDFAVAFKD